MDQLPKDILLIILNLIPIKDAVRLFRCNKNIFKLGDETFWRNRYFQDFEDCSLPENKNWKQLYTWRFKIRADVKNGFYNFSQDDTLALREIRLRNKNRTLRDQNHEKIERIRMLRIVSLSMDLLKSNPNAKIVVHSNYINSKVIFIAKSFQEYGSTLCNIKKFNESNNECRILIIDLFLHSVQLGDKDGNWPRYVFIPKDIRSSSMKKLLTIFEGKSKTTVRFVFDKEARDYNTNYPSFIET